MVASRLTLLLLPATVVAAAIWTGVVEESAGHSTMVADKSALAVTRLVPPKPLRGVVLTRRTGLRLLVANAPPFLLDVDTGIVKPVTGLQVQDSTVWVLSVGKDAVVVVDRRMPVTKVPTAEVYVVRNGATKATRIGTAWAVAPAADGTSVWLLSFKDARRCVLRQLGLDGRQRGRPKSAQCSTRLDPGGSVGVIVQGATEQFVMDPVSGRILLRDKDVLAVVDHRVLSSTVAHVPLTLTDLRSGAREQLPWPSELNYTAEVAVWPRGGLVAVAFADPAYHGGGTQVMDVWLLDTKASRFQHLPDMPADVSLKFTSMSWTSDGRLVMLAQTGGRHVVGVWRPGEARISVRPVRLPLRNSGSDTFVVWQTARPR